MNIFDTTIYSILKISKNNKILNIFNNIFNIDDYSIILPNLYLGNINLAYDISFLKENNISAIVNCTNEEPFNSYFDDKDKLRISINDSKDPNNINLFKKNIINGIDFIDKCINSGKKVYIHCFWGLMRSSTLVCAYLIKKYNIPYRDAILIVKEKRPMALSSLYNFNEVLEYVENYYSNK